MAAIITGSDSGIGKATAVALARRGHDIGITYSRDEQGAGATAEEVRSEGRRAEVRHLDRRRRHAPHGRAGQAARRKLTAAPAGGVARR
jgi:NAD(P)-dependent dehydrogenase (short-subunit alcohol dehydrogenase family)